MDLMWRERGKDEEESGGEKEKRDREIEGKER